MIPQFSESFAYYMIERLIADHILEVSWGVDDNYYPEEEVRAAIRRILMENEREGEDDTNPNDK